MSYLPLFRFTLVPLTYSGGFLVVNKFFKKSPEIADDPIPTPLWLFRFLTGVKEVTTEYFQQPTRDGYDFISLQLIQRSRLWLQMLRQLCFHPPLE